MVRRLTAHPVLQRLQDIELDCSDGDLCGSVDHLGNDVPTSAVESDEKPTVTDSSDKDTDHDAVTDSDGNDDGVQHFIGKDGSSWRILSTFQVQRGRLQQQNVVNVRPAPTEFATNRLVEGFVFPNYIQWRDVPKYSEMCFWSSACHKGYQLECDTTRTWQVYMPYCY